MICAVGCRPTCQVQDVVCRHTVVSLHCKSSRGTVSADNDTARLLSIEEQDYIQTSKAACGAMQAWMLLWELGRMGRISQFQMGEAVYPYALLAPFVLSTAVSLALTALVGWHFFLIWQGQVST